MHISRDLLSVDAAAAIVPKAAARLIDRDPCAGCRVALELAPAVAACRRAREPATIIASPASLHATIDFPYSTHVSIIKRSAVTRQCIFLTYTLYTPLRFHIITFLTI